MEANLDFHPSPIAGRWYPGEAHRLASSVDAYIQEANLPDIKDQVIAVVAPHAGHMYSGPVAGYAFAALRIAFEQPWARLALILGAVALFTGLSGLVFRSQHLRRLYNRNSR